MAAIQGEKISVEVFLARLKDALQVAKIYNNPILKGIEFAIDDGVLDVKIHLGFESEK